MKKISFVVTIVFSFFLAGCHDIIDAVSGINSKANEAAEAISVDVHTLRSIPIQMENQQTVTVNDFIKAILRDVQWKHEKKGELEVLKMNFETYLGTIVSANKIENTTNFVRSLIKVLSNIKGMGIIVVDGHENLLPDKGIVSNYYNDKFEEVFDAIDGFIDKQLEGPAPKDPNVVIVFNSIYKILSK